MLLSLVWAVELSPLSPTVESLAAALLVGLHQRARNQRHAQLASGSQGRVCQAPWGYYLGGLTVILGLPGLGILVVGAVMGL